MIDVTTADGRAMTVVDARTRGASRHALDFWISNGPGRGSAEAEVPRDQIVRLVDKLQAWLESTAV